MIMTVFTHTKSDICHSNFVLYYVLCFLIFSPVFSSLSHSSPVLLLLILIFLIIWFYVITLLSVIATSSVWVGLLLGLQI